MAIFMGATIFIINLLNNTSVIDAVYILASYTYGPILGLFAFGIFMKQQVRDKYIPLVAIASPILCFIILESRGKDKSAKKDKNKRTTISNDTPILIKSLQNASTHPLSLPLSLLSDASSAVSILLPH